MSKLGVQISNKSVSRYAMKKNITIYLQLPFAVRQRLFQGQLPLLLLSFLHFYLSSCFPELLLKVWFSPYLSLRLSWPCQRVSLQAENKSVSESAQKKRKQTKKKTATRTT